MKLSLRELSVCFTDPAGQPLPALGPISFEVAAGEFVCVLGPSGCGKSTLIRALAGLQKATAGQALADDIPIIKPLPELAVMFQDANLMPWRTVRDNIALPLELAQAPADQRCQTVRSLLPQLHLEKFELAFPSELSGGMAQRVALGRIMVQAPRVLLLDEPFGALDAFTREKLSLELLAVWQTSRQTVLMVTHSIHEAVLLADRIVVMSRRPGRMVANLPIDLPRPRRMEMMYRAEFVQLAKRVRQAIEGQVS